MFKFNKDKNKTEKLERIYTQYGGIMYKEAYNILQDSHLAEDAVQQSFIKLMKCIDKIDEYTSARTVNFMKIICRNAAIDIYQNRTYLNTKEDAAELLEDFDEIMVSGPSELVIDNESAEKVTAAIESLPNTYKDIILLEKIHGYSKEDIMSLLNINEEAVKKRMTRAKVKLLEALNKEGLEK